MFANERHEEILNILRQRRKASVAELSRALSVSEVTIRKDLEYLEQHYGLLYDEDSFFIDYEYYGSNLLPEVTVLRRTGAH